ncbi:MAG: PASTA domain-containing protein [Phycisphaerae bacterium]|nr:PASTA domain-containing protein [Phycisphaerae bacterium]
MKTVVWQILAVAMLVSQCQAGEFSGGSGTPEDPFQIGTAQQLIDMGSAPNLLDRCYVLISDIDLDPNLPGGRVFSGAVVAPQVVVMFGRISQGTPFSGTLDGRGYTIRNFTCRADTTEMWQTIGLFGAMDGNAVIRNLKVEGVDMSTSGFDHLGGLLGYSAGEVVHCTVEGALSGAGGQPGGIRIGVAMGGLIGHNRGRVERCYTDMVLHHEGQAKLGGLVGYNDESLSQVGEISDAYAIGSVQCLEPSALGGLVGLNEGRVVRCYAAVSVGPLSGSSLKAGALIGTGDDVLFCYYRYPEGRPALDNGIGTLLTDEEMHRAEAFVGWAFYLEGSPDKHNPWFMPAAGYPVLTWQSDLTGVSLLPEVTGRTQDEAVRLLVGMGFGVKVYSESDRSQPAGLTLYTDPGLYAREGTEIGLYVSAGPYDWSGNLGSGLPDDPYQIQNGGQLDALHARPDLWGAHFQLQNDIDLKSRVYDKALLACDEDLIADGFQGTFFQGHLDGQGHVIRNFTLKSPDQGMYLGLFGTVGQEAVIERLGLDHARIEVSQGGVYVGMVAGYNQGAITQCSIQGSVTAGDHSLAVGGAVGFHAGMLSECQVESLLVADASFLGGLVGRNQGCLQFCRVVTHLQCADKMSNNIIGGMAGHNSGDIHHCYVWGSLDVGPDSKDVGQFTGLQSETGTYKLVRTSSGVYRTITWQDASPARLSRCYAALEFSRGLPDAWTMSRTESQGEITHCLWDGQTWGGYSGYIGVGLATLDMQDPESLALNGWAHDPNWVLNAGQDYPRLAWEGTPGDMIPEPALDWLEGDGTPDKPYLIDSEGVLSRIGRASLLWDRCFSLEADLDLTDWVWQAWGRNQGAGFSGALAGNGHQIHNLTIDLKEPGAFHVGLFGYITESGVVRDLALIDCSILCEGVLEGSGCLAGHNEGTLVNCSVSGFISGGGIRCRDIGMVAGYNGGTLFLCQAEGSVSAGDRASAIGGCIGDNNGTAVHSQSSASVTVGSRSQWVGGLAGNNGGILMNGLACGPVTAGENSKYMGGLAGSNSKSITHCYACNSVDALDPYEETGRLVGRNLASASVSSAYFLSDQAGDTLDNGIGTPLTDAQMRTQSNFEGWDFTGETAYGTMNIWRMPEAGGYPELLTVMDEPLSQGSPPSPIWITSVEDLRTIYFHPLETFCLTNDIDLADIQWTTAPLPLFGGSLDGCGHAILNLSVVSNRNVGLFGRLSQGAQVCDLALENVVMGLVDVSYVVGTLAAVNEGSLNRCVARGRVEGDWYVGGLVGINGGDIVDCYGTVALAAQQWSGGLVGLNDTSGMMRRCYSTGTISQAGSPWSVGPVVGYNYGSAFHCMWDKDMAGDRSSQLGRGMSTEQMLQTETYGLNGWAGSSAWIMDDMQDYPRLSWEETPGQLIPTPEIDWFAGDGTEASPYTIDTPEQLVLLGSAGLLWDRHFVLMQDLDLAGHQVSPIGVCPGSGFSGRFDGQGHVIRNLVFPDVPALSFYVGLFGQVEGAGCITDLRLENVSINFEGIGGQVGCLAGLNSGLVQRCGASGTITGNEGWRVGGLVGDNAGSVESSYADVDLEIVFNAQAGGLVGWSEGDITSAYARGRVDTGKDSTFSGGLVGWLTGELTQSYASGFVQGGEHVGGLVGSGSSESVAGSYFLSPGDGGGPDNQLGLALSRTALSQPASFWDWDFDSTWSVCVGQDYPRLQWENQACTPPKQ